MLRDIGYWAAMILLLILAGLALFSGSGAVAGALLLFIAVVFVMWIGGEVVGTVSE